MVVADFASEFGIRLHAELHAMSWREFSHLTAGLLAADTRLSRALRPETEAAL